MGRLICIFGNSHMSAPAMSGLNQAFAERGDDIRYWGLAGSNFPKFSYEQRRIISPWPAGTQRISGWCEHLDLSEIDTLVCYGFHFSPSYLTRGIVQAQRKHYGLSSAVRRALTEAMLSRWWEEQTGRLLIEAVCRDFPDMPVICYAHPHVSEGFDFFSTGDEAIAEAIQSEVLAFINAKITEMGAVFRQQPDETVSRGIYTARSFNAGAVKYGSEGELHDNDDFRHMNAMYGDHILQDLLQITQQ